jgi:hypothetical protein
VRFELRVVEVANECVGNPVVGWDWDHYERELAAHSRLASIDDVEQALHSYLRRFLRADQREQPSW